jgi:hypothetical protein
METRIYGGIDIAMKVPPHQFEATISFYRDVIGLKILTDKAPAIGFEFGPNRLWIDEAPGMSQAEIWLELFTNDFVSAAQHLSKEGVVRCDAIELLPDHFKGGWFASPASIVHMVREPDAT